MTSPSTLQYLVRNSWRRIAGAVLVATLATACGGGLNGGGSSDASAEAATASGATATGSQTRVKAEAASWVYCATEGSNCIFSGSREVRYGTADRNVVKIFNGSVACGNANFGDPAYGSAKYCWYGSDTAAATTTTPAASTNTSSTGWTYCTWEGGYCSFSGTRTVRFGTTSANVTRTVTGGTSCSTATFGDPAYGQAKSCWLGGTTTAAAAQPAATTPTTTTPTAPSSGVTQVFPLRDQYVWGMQGQLVNFRVRFNGVPLPANSKIYFRLFNMNGGYVNTIGHHLRAINSSWWSGYVQYDYPAYITTNIPAGTYRVAIGVYQAVPPYTDYINRITGASGVNMMTGNYASGYNVGYLTVGAATQSPATEPYYGAFITLNGTGWY